MGQSALPRLLRAFDPEKLGHDSSTLVALDADATIVWVNAAWHRFARENAGESVLARFGPGTSYLSGISPPLRGFFGAAFQNALLTQEPFELDYECSSRTNFRMFHMRVLPIGSEGVLVVHSLTVERPLTREETPGSDLTHRLPTGIVLQCSNCRRVRRADGTAWDWVPAWVERVPGKTSHGLCPACRGYYWGRWRNA